LSRNVTESQRSKNISDGRPCFNFLGIRIEPEDVSRVGIRQQFYLLNTFIKLVGILSRPLWPNRNYFNSVK